MFAVLKSVRTCQGKSVRYNDFLGLQSRVHERRSGHETTFIGPSLNRFPASLREKKGQAKRIPSL